MPVADLALLAAPIFDKGCFLLYRSTDRPRLPGATLVPAPRCPCAHSLRSFTHRRHATPVSFIWTFSLPCFRPTTMALPRYYAPHMHSCTSNHPRRPGIERSLYRWVVSIRKQWQHANSTVHFTMRRGTLGRKFSGHFIGGNPDDKVSRLHWLVRRSVCIS